jgi:hypothetical protein
MKLRNRILWLCMASLILIIAVFIYLNNKDGFQNKKEPSKMKDDNFQLVISRFNENLEWLKNPPFTDFKNIVIYNKGDNDNYYKPANSVQIKLPNVGKCDHTYLYHIIQHYENLPSGFVFLPGSAGMDTKMYKAIQTANLAINHKKSAMVCILFENVQKQLYNFVKDEYITAYGPNYNKNKITKTTKANIRPFGKWFNNKFGELPIKHVTFGGMFAVSKPHIENRPKIFYEKLLAELNYINPEVGHYIERSWEAIFYPMNGAIFVESNYQLDIVGNNDQTVKK